MSSVDPLFMTDTYELQETSPCKENGYPELTEELLGYLYIPQMDLKGNPRLLGEEIDMGAYEYYVAVSTPDSPTNIVTSVSTNTLTIDWDLMPNANSYLVYSSNDPYDTFDYLETVDTNTWNTTIDATTKKFYHIVASSDAVKTDEPVKPIAKKIKIKKIENMLR